MNDGGQYDTVQLRSTSVGVVQISLQGSRVDGSLGIQEVRTSDSVLLGEGQFENIRIVGLASGGTLSLDKSTVSGNDSYCIEHDRPQFDVATHEARRSNRYYPKSHQGEY